LVSSIDKSARRIIALVVVVFAPALMMIWYRAHESTGFASIELIVFPLLFGGIGIAAIVLLKTKFLGESLGDVNKGSGSFVGDIGWGVLLCAAYFVLFFVERLTLGRVLPSTPNLELLGLMLDMRENPWLLVFWFGPVLWIGIALFEELVRTFMLSEMWTMSGRKAWVVVVIVISAAIIGLVHWSQGPYGIVTIAMKSLLAGGFFYYRRRLLPLVVAHVLYDGLQVGALLLTYPR